MKIALESNSSRPIRVDFPSSTLPAVASRSNSDIEQTRHQKYPSFLRSSIPASEIRSSARVAPRSVSREAATSATTSSVVNAADSTQPVQVASPIVRKRTVVWNGSSPSITVT